MARRGKRGTRRKQRYGKRKQREIDRLATQERDDALPNESGLAPIPGGGLLLLDLGYLGLVGPHLPTFVEALAPRGGPAGQALFAVLLLACLWAFRTGFRARVEDGSNGLLSFPEDRYGWGLLGGLTALMLAVVLPAQAWMLWLAAMLILTIQTEPATSGRALPARSGQRRKKRRGGRRPPDPEPRPSLAEKLRRARPKTPEIVDAPHLPQVVITGSCPYCGSPLEHLPVCLCAGCETHHHEDCWLEGNQCTTMGCDVLRALRPTG